MATDSGSGTSFTGIVSIDTRPEPGGRGFQACIGGDWERYERASTEEEAIGLLVIGRARRSGRADRGAVEAATLEGSARTLRAFFGAGGEAVRPTAEEAREAVVTLEDALRRARLVVGYECTVGGDGPDRLGRFTREFGDEDSIVRFAEQAFRPRVSSSDEVEYSVAIEADEGQLNDPKFRVTSVRVRLNCPSGREGDVLERVRSACEAKQRVMDDVVRFRKHMRRVEGARDDVDRLRGAAEAARRFVEERRADLNEQGLARVEREAGEAERELATAEESLRSMLAAAPRVNALGKRFPGLGIEPEEFSEGSEVFA